MVMMRRTLYGNWIHKKANSVDVIRVVLLIMMMSIVLIYTSLVVIPNGKYAVVIPRNITLDQGVHFVTPMIDRVVLMNHHHDSWFLVLNTI